MLWACWAAIPIQRKTKKFIFTHVGQTVAKSYLSKFKLFAFGEKLFRELEQCRFGLNFCRLGGIITNHFRVIKKLKNKIF